MSYISCKQIVKVYRVGDHELVALRGIDFEMEKGEIVAIIGPSGAGKSSLLNLLGGLDIPTAGKLIVDGQSLLELKGKRLADYRLRRVGFLWQQVERNLLAHRSALRNVALPMMLAGMAWRERRQRAHDLLEAVGLEDHMAKTPAQLSIGQQQRVGIAVALANQPGLLLADEPTGALDRASAAQVIALLRQLREQFGLTILMATHDMQVAAHADRILTLRDGALGQDFSHGDDSNSQVDAEGRLLLPDAVRSHLTEAQRIAIEIRPEGVLLRPETEESDDAGALLHDLVPQDAAPQRRRWRIFRRQRSNAVSKS
ncbi:MAG: ABC transporter ATP-binding protein [Anaerolineae bacterium]|nr:ABC transporter ATP-binding protein [Anaerolineae bacterium]